MKDLSFEKNEVLFGSDPTEGIVAVEPVGEDKMRLFLRRGDRLETRDEPFTPFLLLENEKLLQGFKQPFRFEKFSSTNDYKVLAIFEQWGDCAKARTYLHKKTGQPVSSPQAPYLFLSDPVHQYLLLTGKTLFKGLSFKDLHRLALDIETATAPGYDFSNPQREEDRILSIALMDNLGSEEVLFATDYEEGEMLAALGSRITQIDPDVLEGHNLFNFDLEYIVTRARVHGVELPWGRDGSEPRTRRSRLSVAERVIDYTRMDIFGRHVVDTLFLVQYYDVAARELESYALKSAARHFGLATPERTYIEPEKIQWYYEHDPEVLKQYNLDDVRETLALSELLGYSFFLQTMIFPFSYQNIFVRGNATKINALFLREYLRQRASIPKPGVAESFAGGYTDVFRHGIVRPVVSCDAASLYPSILISYDLKPSGDSLNIFLPLLKDLRDFRFQAKKKAQTAEDPYKRDYYEALQQTYKILVNSFYGYLGTRLHHFSDPHLAGEVTGHGREIIVQMIEWIREQGGEPIEIDTDGIYFVPPPGVKSDKDVRVLVERLSNSMPKGIEVEMAGKYQAMFSYKKKNYALMDDQGNVIIKGSALRSRGMEKYLREFLSDMIQLMLQGKGKEVYPLSQEYLSKLDGHEFDIGWLAKTETLTESLESYREKVEAKKRNPAATYELALASGRPYRAGDQVSYYVTGKAKRVTVYENSKLTSNYKSDKPDENVAYYQAKLLDLLKKFKEFLPQKGS
ncbi:MAG: DNA polymerase domain-containing protein [Syntrophobacterales bacterium]|jgi:DNA polymerase elongation subunit (family B)